MLLNEIFGGVPLFENSATAQMVVTHIRDNVPELWDIWLVRENSRAPWRFIAVVGDQIAADDFSAAKERVKRISNAMGGIKLDIEIVIQSAFEQPEGAIKVYARPPLQEDDSTRMCDRDKRD